MNTAFKPLPVPIHLKIQFPTSNDRSLFMNIFQMLILESWVSSIGLAPQPPNT